MLAPLGHRDFRLLWIGQLLSGLGSWLQSLQAGATRSQVAVGLYLSAEHRGQQVDQFYATYLHRRADAPGRAIVREAGL